MDLSDEEWETFFVSGKALVKARLSSWRVVLKIEDSQEEGSARRDQPGKEGDWCAVCHDGGDTLYCCDKCPKVYHLFCYIPPLTSEPADDWVCLMCASVGDVKAVMPEL